MTGPTAPVAPTTPIRTSRIVLTLRGRLRQLEGVVERPHAPVDVVSGDVEGDLDGRGGDEMRLHAAVRQRGERLSGDPGMRLHSRADDAHLPEAVALVEPHAEPLQ